MSARRLRAKYPGHCHGCAGEIVVGEAVVWLPPKGRRERGLTIHDRCARKHAEKSSGGAPGAWRQNAEWMTGDESVVVEDAMSRMRPAGSPVARVVTTEEGKPSAARAADPDNLSDSHDRSLLTDAVAAHHRHKRQSPAGRREW